MSPPPSVAYTDEPELHPNPVVASLQVLAWLFLRPAAWRGQVRRISPELRPDFALADLTPAQWRHPFIRQLLLGYPVWAVGIGLATSALWWSRETTAAAGWFWGGAVATLILYALLGVVDRRRARPDINTSEAELYRYQRVDRLAGRVFLGYPLWFLSLMMLIGIMWWRDSSAALGLVFSMSLGMIFGLTVGITVAIAASVALGIVMFVIVGAMASMAFSYASDNFAFAILLFIFATGLTGSVAGALPGSQAQYPLSRQMLGVAVGVVIGIGVIVISAGAGVGLSAGVAVWGGGQAYQNLGAQLPGVAVNAFVVGVCGAAVGAVTLGAQKRERWKLGAALAGGAGLIFGALSAILTNTFGTLGSALTSAILMSLLLAAMFALPYVLAERVGGAWAGAIAGALSGGAVGFSIIQIGSPDRLLLSIVLILTFPFILGAHLLMAVVLYPALALWNVLLLRLDERRVRPHLLRWNSAFWHEHQPLPLAGLDEHVVLIIERVPAEGRAALEYLLTTRQRWAAQAAQIELDARRLEQCESPPAFAAAHRALGAGELAGPASALLRSFSRLSQDIEAALQQESAYNQRLALSAVEDRLDGLARELTRSSERYAARFRPIAVHWRARLNDHLKTLAEAVEQRQEIDSPYVIGVPLTDQQEIFIGRTDISARIEQLLLDRRRPPLLLYGQRRMGKTSLLNNLGRLLPSTIVPLFVDLQGPASRAADHAGLLYNLARGMIDSAQRQRQFTLPPLARESLLADPFTRFDEWLDEVERVLGDHTALLALDEFEVLDQALADGRFNESDVLGLLRHWIQHRPRFKVLLAGSHPLAEVQRWASYLINVQVVQIGYLSAEEARQLIERPVQGFALRYAPEATARVLALTRGHPFLTQLLCAEIVALKNEHPPATRRFATLEDVAAALPAALEHGSFFFADIERNQVDAAALSLLRVLARAGEGAALPKDAFTPHCPGDLDLTLALLVRRDLIEHRPAGYAFQVELIRRWFGR